MSYNFTDAPTPKLRTTNLPASGDVELMDGSPQGDYITSTYGGTTVVVTIEPPSGWTLTSVTWSCGNGTLTVPDPGFEKVYTFDYTVSQSGASKSNGGTFKIKKAGGL
jgi:hypothetical protein